MLTVKRQVKVFMIMTENTRAKMQDEFLVMKQRYELELEQLSFQSKKLFLEAQRKGREALEIVQQRIHKEQSARQEKLEQISFQLEQIASLPSGSEIHYSTVESYVEIKIGDDWDKLMSETEIVLLDGIVHEIREGGKRDGR
ncbi:YlqD family protein [Aneurinibacillus tyrosinisolvens]|uniref:YlqD family protein n=1 Tax=Aneurinibacillus tyrosinisolvens TaxID=1443435 RepID=UPI00063F11CF|nr:YlqD family protein [Aneurinibacillus tyrosinisolvens]